MANKVYKERRSSIDHRQISSTTKTSNEALEDDDEYLLPEKPIYSSTSSSSSSSSSTSSSKSVPTTITTDTKYKWSLVYRNILLMTVIHGLGIYGVCLIPQGSIATLFWIWLILIFGAIGIQTGAHRLWSHRAYKASTGLRVVLALFHVLGLQDDLFTWCRDHRAHHKFSDTDGDPHNSTRGFFFSHVGWLLVRKHPEVKRRGATIDLSDLKADPVVRFQRKYYLPLVLLFWGALPVAVPVLCWGENLKMAFFTCIFTRYVISLNYTWLVNSWAHMYGTRPYDEGIAPVEASIRNVLLGEGFHNYHHAFPWDYSASELGALDVFNLGTAAINLFAAMGWAWDLKRASPKLVTQK
ncbi:PREDICTED: acyl-CoA desaturase-like, partial [Rhagoletis zephyria]|uniref:acyl-CoA desaturase-like n=1 Tax=Rhagoletis zephyria TaxID=28612 RepID=UPI0008114FBE